MGRLREPERGPRHRGTLVCVVIKAKNLHNRRPIGKQDPYAELTIEGTTQRTRPDRRGGQHPLWDEQLHFELFDDLHGMAALSGRDFAEGRSLHIACFARDRSNQEALGEGRLPLETALRQGECDKWIPLSNRGRYAGEVYVELTFYSSDPPPALPPRTPQSSQQPRSSSISGGDLPQTLHPGTSRSASSVYTPPYAPRTFTPNPRNFTPLQNEPRSPQAQRSISHGHTSMSQDNLSHSFSELSTRYSPDPAAAGHAAGHSVHRPLPSPATAAQDPQDESIVDWGVQSPGWRRPVPPTPADTSLQSPDESMDSMYLQRTVASPAPLGPGAPPAPPLPARTPGFATPGEDPSSPPSFARNMHASTPQMTAQEAIYGTSSPLPVGTHSRPLPPVGAQAPTARRPLPSTSSLRSPVAVSPGPHSTPRPADMSRDSAHFSTERLAAPSPGAAPSPTQAHSVPPPAALGSVPRAASPAFGGVPRAASPAFAGMHRSASPAPGGVPRAASPVPSGVPRAASPAVGGVPRAAPPAAVHLPRPASPGTPHVASPSGGAVPDTIQRQASRSGGMHKWS